MSFAKDLRASVLHAAMQGKLTEQLETDTPVSELLADISAKTKKKITLLENDDLPINWGSVKITDAVTLYTGNSISESVKTAKYCGLKEGYDYIGTKDVNFDHTICYNNGVKIPFNEPNFRYAEKDATLLCIEGGSAGRKIAILDKKVCFGNKLCAFYPIDIESKFLYFFLQSPQFFGVFTNNISGIIGGVSINKIKQMTLPIPPIEEQKRIVQRIEEIMKHIDELEAIEEELKKLKEAFPADMKAAVLQAAMQGKLTEQLETDSSVDNLLENIKTEREKLVKEGKIKKGKMIQNNNFVAFGDSEALFEIPDNWRWVKLGDIGYANIGLTYSPKDITSDGTVVLRSSNIQNDKIDYSDIVKVKCDIPDNKMCQKGDILICARNGSKRLVGKSAIIDKNGMSFGAFMALFRSICNPYIVYVINSPYFRKTLIGDANTMTINQITQDMLKKFVLPLPPLEEQNRIVAKLEQILPLIADLS